MKEGLEEKETPKKKKKGGKGSGETSFHKIGKKRNVHSSLCIPPRQRKEKGGR